MKRVLQLPSKEVLSERLNYDPETGKLFWKHADGKHFKTERGCKVFNAQCAGQEAGHKHLQDNGSPHAVVIRITVQKKGMWLLAHRVAYQLMGVDIPEGMEIDHKDCDPWNNSWGNHENFYPFAKLQQQVFTSKDFFGFRRPSEGRLSAKRKIQGSNPSTW